MCSTVCIQQVRLFTLQSDYFYQLPRCYTARFLVCLQIMAARLVIHKQDQWAYVYAPAKPRVEDPETTCRISSRAHTFSGSAETLLVRALPAVMQSISCRRFRIGIQPCRYWTTGSVSATTPDTDRRNPCSPTPIAAAILVFRRYARHRSSSTTPAHPPPSACHRILALARSVHSRHASRE